MMTQKFWRTLVEAALKTREDEIDCAGCFELLYQYVDLLEAGQDPAQVLPQLEQHLSVCHCCHSELDALLVAIRASVEPEG